MTKRFVARELAFKKEYKKKAKLLLCDYILNEYPNYSDRTLKGTNLAWDGDYKKRRLNY
jgi:hypothetical protein